MTASVFSPSREKRSTIAAMLGIATATPPVFSQEHVLPLAIRLASATPDQEAWIKRIYRNSGVRSRGTVLALGSEDFDALSSFYPSPASAEDRGPTTAQRMTKYAEYAPVLAESAVERAISNAAIDADELTHLITASCTGFFAPGLDAALIQRLGLPSQMQRQHIGFMGCHAAFNALAAARDAIANKPSARVLVCCVELCSLHFAYGSDPGKLVANALFADGAAAVVMGRSNGTDQETWRLLDHSSTLLPESSQAMQWRIGDHGFEMTLSPGVPEIVRRDLRRWCEQWLARHGLTIDQIKSWAIHPGGPKILAAVADGLSLPPAAMRESSEVLACHGNMSSPTVLFILDRLQQRSGKGLCVAIGLGPGLMAEGMLLER